VGLGRNVWPMSVFLVYVYYTHPGYRSTGPLPCGKNWAYYIQIFTIVGINYEAIFSENNLVTIAKL